MVRALAEAYHHRMDDMDDQEWLTTAEAAELLGITPRSVLWDLYHRDDFPRPRPSHRTGTVHEFPRAGLREWRLRHPAKRAA